MLSKFSRYKQMEKDPAEYKKTTKIAWIEIPATKFERAVLFYESVLSVKLELQTMIDRSAAFFDEKEFGIKGCIIETKVQSSSGGIRPIFFVNVMYEALQNVEMYGGKVITAPALLKQQNNKGEAVIGGNLIDKQVGYICEITDSEGNGLFLYSHS